MSSVQFPIPAQTWVQITTTDKQGSIRHMSGNGAVIYTESPTEPAAFSDSTPVMEETTKTQDFTYYAVGDTDFIWAYSISEDSVITVTPGSV